jgi:hypothetical protein
MTLFVLWTTAHAGFRVGGAGNCGNFADAIALVEDGDVVAQMVPARDSGSPVITKNLRLSGGWLPTENCLENNQFYTETSDYLAYGFQYSAPYTRSELFSNSGPVLNLEDTADPTFPNLDQLIIEHLILANTFDFPANGAGINGTISGSAEILLDNVWLRGNQVSGDGGGIHLEVNGGSHLVIEDSAFYTNTADNYGGGLTIEVRQGSYLTIENTAVISNQALFAGGMQIVVYDTSQVFIRNAHFTANGTTSINGYGGGGQIIMHGGQVTLDNVTFVGNQAGSNEGQGGGLFVQMDGGQVTIQNSRFLNNSAGDGGGLYLESVGSEPAALKMINTRFEGNSPNAYQLVSTGTGDLNSVILDHSIYQPQLLNPSDSPIQTARINQITLDDAFNFIVEFESFNFTPTLPGVHVHFFFDTVAAEDAGAPGPGPWFVYGGTSPFTGYHFAERPFGPDGAEKICVLVANPNHTVRLGSGNCVKLP